MSLIAEVGRKSVKSRVMIYTIYSLLTLMGVCMVVPFMITVSGSLSNDYDYDKFSPVPTSLFSEKERFLKGLVPFFNQYRSWGDQLRAAFPDIPDYWSNWSIAGRDTEGVRKFASNYLDGYEKNKDKIARQVADYHEFAKDYPLTDTVACADMIDVIRFIQKDYARIYLEKHPDSKLSGRALRKAVLETLNNDWSTSFETVYNMNFDREVQAPMDFQGWFPKTAEPRFQAFLRFKEHQRKLYQPAGLVVPYSMRAVWYKFLQSEFVSLRCGHPFTIADYNRMAGTNYTDLPRTPFPIHDSFGKPIRELWEIFQKEYYPLRLVRLKVTSELENAFRDSAKAALKDLKIANQILGTNFKSWEDFRLLPYPSDKPEDAKMLDLWRNFAKTLPLASREFSSSEHAFQDFVLKKYGSVEGVNQAYGTTYKLKEEIFPPFHAAYLETFLKNQYSMTLRPITRNYSLVGDYLLFNGNAVLVTVGLILLTLFFTLTVNPLAAYALSRFSLRGHDKIILFMLATMAFPTMVSAIPAYLLLRDFGLLNTMWALVLPGAANGMSIFILKGFFDSLPMELFEAATIDGASEFQIFRVVAMPLVKPILAINSLTAFMVAYNGWEWALIICQDKSMWTIAVWMYQASMWWGNSPWLVSAGFILTSIPTLIVFLSCQKIILRGIVIPTMK